MTEKRLHLLAALVGLAIAALALTLYTAELLSYPSLAHFHGPVAGGDFRSFWAPARLVWLGEAHGAYDPDILTPMLATIMSISSYARLSPMYYPPSYLLLLSPIGLLEFFPAYVAFCTLGAMAFLFTMYRISGRLWFMLLMLAFSGLWVNIVSGQNGLFTSSLFGLGFAALPASPLLAGVFFGLLTIKPHLGLLIPVALIASRRWSVIGSAAMAALALVILSALAFGPDIWLWGLTGMGTASLNLSGNPHLLVRIPSAFSFMRLSGMPPGQAMLLHLLLAASLMVLVWGIWRHSRNTNLNAAATAGASLLCAPFLYDYDTALLAVGIAFMAREIARTGWWWGERVVLPLLMFWPMLVGWIAVTFGAQLGLMGPVLLVLLAVRRIRAELAVTQSVAPPPSPALQPAA